MHRTLSQIFIAPLLVAIVSTLGLVGALVGDGWWDTVSWVTLAVPVVLYALFIWGRKPN
ncbi:hypothetical protein [Bradyrhizobium cenepequi]|uniref:hypothetical protein n=1 Tax=Bradyrhizobium cenepequi TaxID=2821403 RepID=UPI001CE2E8F5|nr:hypothetical protein [Bradyrhizobium cenepequi]